MDTDYLDEIPSLNNVKVARDAWELLQSHGGLVTRVDVARIWKVTQSAVTLRIKNKAFPKPVGNIGGRDVFLWEEVRLYE